MKVYLEFGLPNGPELRTWGWGHAELLLAVARIRRQGNQNVSISSTQAVRWSGWSAVSFQPFPDPQRIPAAIQYGMHTNHIPLHTVVDGKREALGETPAMTVYDLMNSGVHEKGVNV
jgi:hypothetical protein